MQDNTQPQTDKVAGGADTLEPFKNLLGPDGVAWAKGAQTSVVGEMPSFEELAFRDARSLQKAKDRFLLEGEKGRMAYAQFLLGAVQSDKWRPRNENGMREVVSCYELLARGGRKDEAAMLWHASPSAEEQGVEARYNFILQGLERANRYGLEAEYAVMSDAAMKAKIALDEQEDVGIEPIENLARIGARTTAQFERVIDPSLGRVGSGAGVKVPYQTPYAVFTDGFAPVEFRETPFGAGFASGGARVYRPESGEIGGLKIIDRAKADFDFENAQKVSLAEDDYGVGAEYYTLPDSDGDMRVAIPFGKDKVLLATRQQLTSKLRQERFAKAMAAPENENFRKLVSSRLAGGLSATGLAWLKRHTANGAGELLERDEGGTWVPRNSNLVSKEGVRAFKNLSKEDQEILFGILSLNAPTFETGGFWKTVGFGVMLGVDDMSKGIWRGTQRFVRDLALSKSELDGLVEEDRLRDAFNALGTPRPVYDESRASLRYGLTFGQTVPATTMFFASGVVGKGGSALGALKGAFKARGLKGVGAELAVRAVSNAPLAFTQTMAGYEQAMADVYLRLESDEELRRALPTAHRNALTTGFLDYALEYIPFHTARKYVQGTQNAFAQALRTGSRKAAFNAGARYMGANFASMAFAESAQETLQNMLSVVVNGVADSQVDWVAAHGTTDGWEVSDEQWGAIAEEAGAGVMPSIVTSIGIVGATQGAAGLRLSADANIRLGQIKAYRNARNAARAGVETLRGRREAKGVHMPAYDLAIESETRANVARMKQRLGRELTDDELVAAQEAARERVAYEDFKQMYNAWSAETDEAKRDAFLNRQGFTAGEKAKLISAFDTIFAYRAGAQFGGQVADVAESIRASLQSVGLAAELETREDGSALLRFGGVDAPATEIRFVQQVQDPDAEAHAAMGVTPDGVFIRAADGTEVDATQPVNAVIEIQRQSQGGSTFLLGHELAHNLLDVLRRTGTLTQEMDAQLAKKFKGKDGAFDEEAFADAFGAELRDAFTLQEEARVAKAPKTKVGRILRGMADTVRDWAYATFAFRRAREDAKAAQANAPASVLEAFLAKQGTAQKPAEDGGQQNQGAGAQGAETSQAKPGENGPVPADGQEGATRVRMEGGGEGVGPAMFHIQGLLSGSSEAYDKPSAQKIGSGANRFSYGWGLYSTTRFDTAAKYAKDGFVHGQTWWTHRAPGDESHLLGFDEPVSEENLTRILDGFDREGMTAFFGTREDVRKALTKEGEEGSFVYESLMDMVSESKRRMGLLRLDGTEDEKDVSRAKAASEFLHRSDIDGAKSPKMRNGDVFYVSFSDERLRVDKRWAWDGERYVEDRAFTQGAKYHGAGNGWNHARGMSVNAARAYDDGKKPKEEWSREDFAKAARRVGNEGLAKLIESKKIPLGILRSRYLSSNNFEWHHIDEDFNAKEFYALMDNREDFDRKHGWLEEGEGVFLQEDTAERLLAYVKREQEAARLHRAYLKAWKAAREGMGTAEERNAAYKRWMDFVNANNSPGPKFHLAGEPILDEPMSPREAKAVLDIQRGKPFTNRRDNRTAIFNTNQIRKILSKKAVGKSVANGFTAQQHNRTAVNVGKLYENAILLEERGDSEGDPNVVAIRRYASPIQFSKSGKEASAYITIKESEQNGNRIYSLELLELKDSRLSTGGLASNQHHPAREPVDSKASPNTDVKFHIPGQAEDAAYLDAVEQGDMETARRMVEEAAKRAGYTIEAYHGSDQFGFTVFNPERSDDERSLFFAGSQALASTYTEARDISRIGGKAFLDGNFKTFEELSKALEPLGLRLELSGAKLVDGDRAIEVKEFRKHKNEYETEITLVPYDTEALNEAAVASANDYAKATYGMSLQEAGGLDEAAKNDIRRFYREWRYEHRSDYSTTPNQVAAAINRRKRKPFRSKPGIYEVALKLENPLVVDADGANWNAIRLDDKTLEDYKEFLEETYGDAEFHGDPEEARTREISEYAEARGYDGVIFKNLFDYGPMGVAEGTDTVYVAFDGRQAKSLDPVTYDDEGRVIPLSERFNPANPDIRYHLAGQAKGTTESMRSVWESWHNADGSAREGWMMAPNGKPTNLTERQWLQVRTPEFKRYFGDWENDPENASKVVDENGEPLVVYHRTDADFWAFDMGRARQSMDLPAVYFSSGTEDWGGMGERVVAAFLNLRNPKEGKPLAKGDGRSVRDALLREGYDGTIEREEGMETEYGVFDPKAIKSATDNVGTFDLFDTDIRYHIPDRGAPRFSETEAGKAAVAAAFDAMTEGMWDLISDPTGRSQRKGAKKQQDVTTEEGFVKEVNIRMGQFGRAGGPRLQELKKRLSAEQWQDVLGTVFEIGHRFDVWHKDGGLLDASMRGRVADYLQDIIRNRASMLGRRAYMAGRDFAWRRWREEHREVLRALAEKRSQERKASREKVARLEGDLKDLGREYGELETQAENLQKRVNRISDMIDTLNADKADLRERMREAVRAERVRQARKDAVRREVGVTSKQLKDVLGLDVADEVRRIAYSEEDILEGVERLVAEIDEGFEAWVRYERPDLAEGLGKGSYTAQGNRAYAQTVGDVLKMLGRSLAYGRTRESVLMISDAVRGVGRDRARNALEGKLARVVSDLRRSHGKGLLKAFDRAMRVAFAEAGKRLEAKPVATVKRFRAEWEKTVDALRRAMALALEAPKTKGAEPAPEGTPSAVEGRIAELQAAIDKAAAGKVDEEGGTERLRRMATELMFLQRYGGIAHMENPVEAYALMQEAVAFIREGLFKHVAEWERAYARAKGLKDAIVGGLEPASGNPKRGFGVLAWSVPSLFDKLKWPLKTRASLGAVDALEREFSRAASFEAKWNREDFTRICGMAADAYGLSGEGDARSKAGYEKWMALVSERKPHWASALSLDGRTLSRANLIYIYASLRQADVYKEMAPQYAKWAVKGVDAKGEEVVLKEGIDAYLSLLEGELDAGDLALAEMAVKFFADKREPLSAVSERVLGVPVYSPEENYVPLRVEADVDMTEGKVRQFMLLPNFLKQRVKHSRKIDESESLYGILVGRSRQQNRWMAYADLYLLTRETLGDPEVNARMNHALGTINMRSLNKQILDVFAGLEMTSSDLTKFARSSSATLGLGFNFGSAIRQFEGISAWGIDFGVGDTAGALWKAFEGLATEEGRARFMREYRSEILTARMDTGNSLEMQQAIAMIGGLTGSGRPRGPKSAAANLALQAYTQKAFAMIKHTDAFVCALGMTGLRPLLEDKWRRLGHSAEEARELADRELDIAIQRLQQSGRQEYLSELQRAGLFGSLMSMFTGPSAMRAGIWLSAANDVQKGLRLGDKALWSKGLNRLAATYLSALFYAMLNNLVTLLFRPLGDDEEADDRAKQMLWEMLFVTLTGPLSGLAVLGPMLNTAVRNVSRWLATDGKKKSNVRYFLGRAAVFFPAVDTFVRAGYNFVEESEEFAESDFDAEAVVRYFLGGLVGTVTPGGKQAEALLENVGVLEEEKKKRR